MTECVHNRVFPVLTREGIYMMCQDCEYRTGLHRDEYEAMAEAIGNRNLRENLSVELEC